MLEFTEIDIVRFRRNVQQGEPTQCWPWSGGVMNKGRYGDFRWGGAVTPTRTGAHRVAFFLANGRWPSEASHLCGNSLCCNPAHIIEETHQENIGRSVMHNARKVTCPRGHPYDAIYTTATGVTRKCNTCRRERYGSPNPKGPYNR